jgi:hypothetical protein
MYGGLPRLLLDVKIIMLVSSMIIANLLGFTYCVISPKFFNVSEILSLVERQFSRKILTIQTNGGRVSGFELFLPAHRHSTSCFMPSCSSAK